MSSVTESVFRLLGLKKAERELRELGSQTSDTSGEFRDLNGRLRDSRGRFIAAGNAANDAADDLERLGNEADDAGGKFGDLREGLNATAKGFGLAAAAIGAVSFVAIGKSAISASSQMETFEAQLSILLKSSDAAKERLADLFEIGSTTPFELDELVRADQILTSFGADANVLRGGVMDLAGALGGELPEAAMAVAKSFGAGRGASDALRESYALLFNDIVRRADELGGSDSIENWRKATIAALTEVDSVVAGGTQQLAATLSGQLSNVSDQWFKFTKQIGDAGLFDYSKLGIAELLEGLDSAQGVGQDLAEFLSTTLVDSIDGTVRVLGVLANTFLAITMAIKFTVQGLSDLQLFLARTRLAFLKLEKATDFLGTLEGEGVLADKFRKDLEAATIAVEQGEEALQRYNSEMDALGDAFMNISRTGQGLDEVREKLKALREEQAKQMEGERKLAEFYANAPKSQIPRIGADEPGPATSSGGSSKTKKSQARKDLEKFEARLQTIVDADTLGSVKKFDVLLRKMNEAMGKARGSTRKAFELLIDRTEKVRAIAQKQANDKSAEKRAAEIRKFEEQLRKAGQTATKSAMQLAGQWKQSDELALKIQEATAKVGEFRSKAVALGLDSAAAAHNLAALEGNLEALVKAREESIREEVEVAKREHRAQLPILRRIVAELGEFAKSVGASFREGFSTGVGNIAGKIGSMLQGVINLGTGGLGSLAGAAGPAGGAIAGLAQLGGMGTTRTEEFVDKRTGQTRTREVEVSASEVIAKQFDDFLDGFLVGLVEVLPDLIGEVIPQFIAEGIPALVEGIFRAVPALLNALFVRLPKAFVDGLLQWWGTVWESIKEFFKSVGGTGGGALAGAGAGAAIGSIIPGIGTLLGAGIGAATGALFGGMFHSGGYATKNFGMGIVNRTGPALLAQGERVIPPTGAGTQTATNNGLGAFMPSGATVNISTAALDSDVVDRLGVMLDEHFGYGGRNRLPIFGG